MPSPAFREAWNRIDWSKPIVPQHPERPDFREGRSPTLTTPAFLRDGMDPVQSMATGKFYDSKSAIRAEYKALGLTEVGNDSSVLNPKPFQKPRPDRTQIKAAVGKAFSRAGLGT
jgi:hypothetical protein